LAIDQGKIDTGNEADLFSVARELVRALPAQFALKSKSERGYEFAEASWARRSGPSLSI